MGMGPISSRCRSPWAFAPPGLGKIHLRWSQTRWTGNLWGWGWGGGWDAVVDAGDPWDVPMFYSEVDRIRHDHHQHHHFLWSSWSGDNHHHGLYLNYSVGSWFWIRDPRDPRRPYKESPKKHRGLYCIRLPTSSQGHRWVTNNLRYASFVGPSTRSRGGAAIFWGGPNARTSWIYQGDQAQPRNQGMFSNRFSENGMFSYVVGRENVVSPLSKTTKWMAFGMIHCEGFSTTG